ncbi:unnamed protein product [Blepharisma stoltei]|uniref:Tyrosine-protein kinase ephrin type A/B receptor-like domain-containing protein n=1 Tax=Blepharisma stoltei TaxID=1481888 RepID=A0AAU9J567_9CILI|nr:unnamed protein product [Blepharisma stoltei]
MIQLIIFLPFALGFEPERLPYTNPPPDVRGFSIMDNFPPLNLLIVYGGYSDPTSFVYGDIWTFNITSQTWSRLIPSDGISPTGRYSGGFFRILLKQLYCIFGGMSINGPLNDLWCFQIQGFLWSKIKTTGDIPSPRIKFGYTSFYDDNNKLQFALLGGVTMEGLDDNLYILDTSTWVWTKMPQSGDAPGNVEGSIIVHYNKKIFTAAGENAFLANSHTKTLLYYDLDPSAYKWVNVTSAKTYTSRIFGGGFLKGSEFYLMMGWSIEKVDHESAWFKVDLDDPSYEWTEVAAQADTDNLLQIDSYGYTLINSTVYIFGGNNNPPIINRMAYFDLDKQPVEFFVYDDDLSPSPRMYHTMQPIAENLYLFGGLGDDGLLHNDFWAFSCIEEKWSSINSAGDIPTKRYGHASATYSDVLFIWGGSGQDGYLNDGYLYDISSGKWTLLTYTDTAPTPRVGACAGFSGFRIYIYGGLTQSGLSDELWFYDLNKNEYTLVNSQDSDGPGPIYYATCRIAAGANNFLWVMYGEAEDNNSTNQVYGYDAGNDFWYFYSDDPSNTTFARSRAAVCKPLQRVLVVGGETSGIYPSNDFFYFSTITSEFQELGTISDVIFASASAYFQNYFYIHGGGTAATSLLRFNVPSNLFIRLPMWTFCTDNITCSFACSPGSYRTATNCEICPPGTYSNAYNSTECAKCPKGKYGPHYGATSLDMCFPCSEGEYNDKEGQELCIDCPASYTCKVGSITYSETLANYEDEYSQPSIYTSDMTDINRNTLIVQVTVGIVGLLVAITCVLIRQAPKILVSVDLYTDRHNHFEGIPMYLKRTKIGGLFGIMFIFLAIMIVGVAIVNFTMNNLYETKSLVPLVVLEQDVPTFSGKILIAITLKNYGGTCLSKTKSCSSTISSSIDGITGTWTTPQCNLNTNGDCEISSVCSECTLSSEGVFTITMDDSNGYTSGFTVNVTSSSSIPGKVSSYQTTILSDAGYVFMGSTATEIYFDMIPSYYENTYDNVDHTGYHVSKDTVAKQGSQYEPFELGMVFVNYLVIEFDLDNNGLVTARYYNQTWIVFLTTLLGSIFGVMGALGGIMKVVEKNWIKIKNKRHYKRHLEQLDENAKEIERLRKDPDFLNYIDDPLTGTEIAEKKKPDIN